MNGGTGDRLGALRRGRGLTQEQLAEKAGVSVDTIRKLEQGRRGGLRVATLEQLAGALGVTRPRSGRRRSGLPASRRAGPGAGRPTRRTARVKVDDLPAGFRYHDLRHYLASLLIASGADVKTVQARLRHASAKTTLDTYGHMWPDRDESTRAAVEAVFQARADSLRTAAGQR